MKKLFLTVGSWLLLATVSVAQIQTAEQYIAKYKNLAIREMRRRGVPASITLAQGLLETENGNSELFRKSNNHFGIKCKNTWSGESVAHDDDAKGECFRVYKTDEDSYRDHSEFLRERDRYAFLFRLNPLDYKAWAYGLKKAGYATNPRYPEVLIRNIEQYSLQQYSLQALNDSLQEEEDSAIATAPVDTVRTAITVPAGTRQMINGCKCIWELKGTSLLAIAMQLEINLNTLLDYNDLTADQILDKDQWVFLEKKGKTGAVPFCVVPQGATLYDLSQQYGVQLQAVLELNGLKPNAIVVPGAKIYLQPRMMPATVNAPVVQPPVQDTTRTHLVEPKEGLFSIAKKYGITVQQLRDWNHLESDSLSIGQSLIVAP